MTARALPQIAVWSLFFTAMWPVSAAAEQTIYRCVINGVVTFKDEPCDGRPRTGVEKPLSKPAENRASQNSAPGRAIDLDYSTPYGNWWGQAQYQASVRGQPVPDAHAVVPLAINIEPRGRVSGASRDNGCQLLGVAAPYVTPAILTLDVTLSGCRYPALNRRYQGTLTVNARDNNARFSLSTFDGATRAPGAGPASYDIKATMKR